MARSLVQFPTLGNCTRNHPYSSSHTIENKTEYTIEGAVYKNTFSYFMVCNTVFGFLYMVDFRVQDTALLFSSMKSFLLLATLELWTRTGHYQMSNF